MTIFHYFFGNDKQRSKFIFNLIAPLYGKIDNAISEDYISICKSLNSKLDLSKYSILDIGTGTGAWITAIAKHSSKKVVGTDFSQKMIDQARIKHPEFEFVLSDGENLNSFADNSFDIVTASFVLHGMKKKERTAVLLEMKRVAIKYVFIHDFHKKTALFVRVLEFFERSDYINFKKYFTSELKEVFNKTYIIEADNGNAIYIGQIN